MTAKRVTLKSKGFDRAYHVLLDGVKVGEVTRQIASTTYTGKVNDGKRDWQVWGLNQKEVIAVVEMYLT